jgi:hypothetical protein
MMTEPRWGPRTRWDRLLVLGIVLVAFVVRAFPVLHGGGILGHLGYDDGDRESADGLSPATQEEISDSLPVVRAQGPVKILLPGPTVLP